MNSIGCIPTKKSAGEYDIGTYSVGVILAWGEYDIGTYSLADKMLLDCREKTNIDSAKIKL